MKRLITFLLSAVLIFSMAAGAAASSSGRISSPAAPITDLDFGDLNADPGLEIVLPLTADMFRWSDGTQGSKDTPVTMSQINAASIGVQYKTVGKSKDVVKSVEIESRRISAFGNTGVACVVLEFANSSKTETVDFEFNLYLTIRNSRVTASEVYFGGRMEANVVELWGDDDYYDLSGGDVVEAMEYIREIELYLGEGMYVVSRLIENSRYYAEVNAKITSADEKLLDAYPEIEEIFRIDTNLTGTVTFDINDVYHVYDGDGKYVGTTEDELKMSKAFYLASEQIQMGSNSSSNNNTSNNSNTSNNNSNNSNNSTNTSNNNNTSNSNNTVEVLPNNNNNSVTQPTEVLPSNPAPTVPSNINDNPGTGF